MALVALYPAAGVDVDDEFGDPIDPEDGVRVTLPSSYYDPIVLEGRLLRGDPLTTNVRPVYATSVGDPYITYVVPGNGTGVVGNGVANDRAALHTLANVTAAATGATITFTPGTYLISSGMTFPAHVALEFLPGAKLKLAAAVEVTILGNVQAGQYQIFDCSAGVPATASQCDVLLTGREIRAEWFGSLANNTNAFLPLVQAMRAGRTTDGGVTVKMRSASLGSYYATPSKIELVGDGFSGLKLLGPGWLKHTANEAEVPNTSTPLLWIASAGGTGVKDTLFRDLRLSGNGSQDFVQVLMLSGSQNAIFENIRIENNAKEGIATSGPNSCDRLRFLSCRADNIGKGGGPTGQQVSAFNANANKSWMAFCEVDDAGVVSEQTGTDAVFVGNLGRNLSFKGMQFHSTTWCNQRLTATANIVFNAPSGIFFADQGNSMGAANVANNVLVACAQGANIGATGKHGVYLHHNYYLGGAIDGSVGNECIFVGNGRNHIADEIIDLVRGSTTGSISVNTATLTVAGGDGICSGARVTIAGVTGTRHVLSCTMVGANKVVTLSSNADATVAGAAVTWTTTKWGYCYRFGYNERSTVRGGGIYGLAWNSAAIRIAGPLNRVEGVDFDPSDDTYGSTIVLQLYPPGGLSGVSGELLASDFDPTRPWSYCMSRPSHIHAAAAPPQLTWIVGSTVTYLVPTAGGFIGLVCTTSGTAGTLNSGATTGNATSGAATLTVSSALQLCEGQFITHAGFTGTRKILSIDATGLILTLDANATSTTGGALAYSAPVWKTWGAISA